MLFCITGLPVPIAAQPIREACGSSLLHGAAKELLHYRGEGFCIFKFIIFGFDL